MNKKGFTLIELIMVIIIIGIIGMMTIPGIMKSLTESRKNSGENVEKILKSNLEMYNIDNEADLWCNRDDYDSNEEYEELCGEEENSNNVNFTDLKQRNPDIDLGECLLKGTNSLTITKIENHKYKYSVNIVCSKDFTGENKSDYSSDGIHLNIDNTDYRLIRSKEHSTYKTNLKIFINDEDKSGKGIRDSEALLKEYIPDLTSSLLGSVILLGQGLPQRFTNNTPSGRKEVLEKLSKSDFMIEDLKNRITNRKSELNTELRTCEDDILAFKINENKS